MNKKLKVINWPRKAIQAAFFVLIVYLVVQQLTGSKRATDFEAYCPFGGLQALGSYLQNQALSCTMTTNQIIMGILLFLAILAFSKLFCSFICPVGTASEWLSRMGRKIKTGITITGWPDKVLRIFKYVLLFLTFYFTLQSNELFCKKYDPYYALTSGFGSDVVLLYAAIALILVIAGSFFLRLFWCKYICPLGALSNIFKFWIFFVIVVAAYIVALHFGIKINYGWPLAVLCLGGYLIEILRMKSSIIPVVRITRDEEKCISCGLCTLKCPQAIDVDKVKHVKHVDCNMCSDCLSVCPVKDTLQVSGKRSLRWLAPVATILLVVIGIVTGNRWELPTIDLKWGNADNLQKALVYQQEGLKNVKCYGSSMAFANQMKQVEGVLGVSTFVKKHKVRIYYDPERIGPEKIREAMFTPLKSTLVPLPENVQTVTGLTFRLENFFDPYDFMLLSRLLEQKTDVLALVSEYDCPVTVRIFFAGDTVPDEKKLIQILESESVIFKLNDFQNKADLNFKVAGKIIPSHFSRKEYLNLLFDPYNEQFNQRQAYSDSVISIYEVPLGDNSGHRARFPFLVSHLSNNQGIVEFQTLLDSAGTEMLQILFVDTMTNAGQIHAMISSDSLKINYNDGTTATVVNIFDFETEGKVLLRNFR